MRNLAFLLLVVFCIGSCRLPNFEAKSVTINGLGSLQSLGNKQFTENELALLLKETDKLPQVNEQDARVMLQIFNLNTRRFFNASQNPVFPEAAGFRDIAKYLKLVMDYEQLREPVEEAMWRESKRMLMQEIDFRNLQGNTGEFVGQFISVYAKAFTQTVETDKNRENLLEDKENKTLFLTRILTLKVFEEKAEQIVNNGQANNEEAVIVKQFLENIKTYNEAMPNDEKILDRSGRLVEPNAPTTSAGERAALNNLALGTIDYKNKPQAEEASRQVGNIVRPTAETIELKVKTSFIPR